MADLTLFYVSFIHNFFLYFVELVYYYNLLSNYKLMDFYIMQHSFIVCFLFFVFCSFMCMERNMKRG